MLISFNECIAYNKGKFNGVVHIGAHHGEEVEAYYSAGVKEVFWFEANKNMMKHLFDKTNRYQFKQEYVCQVLSDIDDEEVEFKVTNNGQSSSILELGTHLRHYPDINVIETQKLKAKRFDNYIQQNNINIDNVDFINLDVQGAELKVLNGFGNMLNNKNIKAIYTEVNFEELYVGAPHITKITEYLQNFGYSLVANVNTKQMWGDALYLRK